MEYNGCKEELIILQEENERVKIKFKDLKEIVDLSKVSKNIQENPNLVSTKDNRSEVTHCQECDYILMNKEDQTNHMLKHKSAVENSHITQKCYICKNIFDSSKTFRSHIQENHKVQYNCEECDFQAGDSKIILSKHMNLRHRNEAEQENDTFKCDKCNNQYSSKWNLNNHKRDEHERTEECSHYEKGNCRFPDKVCWKLHKKLIVSEKLELKTVECFTCKNKFKSKSVMMIHRKEEHPDKVRLCNDPIKCGFQKCWFIHSESEREILVKNKSIQLVEVENEAEQDFQKGPILNAKE